MQEVHAIIKTIENLDLKEEGAFDAINFIISEHLKSLPAFLTYLDLDDYLVRSRYLDDTDDFHHYISDYAYNPNPEKIKIGRANVMGQQIFYASRFRVTSLAEVRFIYANREREDTRYSIGRWDLRKPIQVAAIVNPSTIRQHGASEINHLADFIEEQISQHQNGGEEQRLLTIYQYLAGKYVQPVSEGEEYKYKITAAFSNFLYTRFPIADGILYQSVQYPQHYNVALKRKVVDERVIHLTRADRQTYVRTGPISFRENESIPALKVDYDIGKVIWK